MTDHKELREAIADMDKYLAQPPSVSGRDAHFMAKGTMRTVLDGARIGLATLPREVTVEAWAVVRPDGSICGLYKQDSVAAELIRECPDYIPVHLTGNALLPAGKE